jgi:hypothetical protein
MTSLTSGRFQLPLNLTEGNTIDFVFRLSNNGVLFTPALTPVWIFGIKDADTPSGSFLIQVNSATAASGVFTFVVELASAELQAWLATATSQSYAAIQITDSANDIATGPLLCQIEPNQNDTGTTPTSALGTLNVAAGKTVTFPQSLTFPSALGTNGFQLTTDGAGALTWAAGTNAPGGSTTQVQYNNAGSFAGITGATTDGTALTLVAPVLGAATATSINGIVIFADNGAAGIYMTSNAGGIDMSNSGGNLLTSDGGGIIDTSFNGGNIYTSGGGGSISTSGTGSIELGVTGIRTTFTGSATSNRSIALPNANGTLVLNDNSATITNKDIVATQLSGNVAVARIATALASPGTIGNTTAATSVKIANGSAASTALQIGAVSNGIYAPSGAGTDVGISANGSLVAFWNSSWGIVALQPIIPNSNGLTSVGTSGLRWSNVFSVLGNFSGAVTCSTTLAVTSTTTMSGRLTANGGITVVGGSYLLTTNTNLTGATGTDTATLGTVNAPVSGSPTKWILINDNGTERYIPTWDVPPPPP